MPVKGANQFATEFLAHLDPSVGLLGVHRGNNREVILVRSGADVSHHRGELVVRLDQGIAEVLHGAVSNGLRRGGLQRGERIENLLVGQNAGEPFGAGEVRILRNDGIEPIRDALLALDLQLVLDALELFQADEL